MLRQHRRDSGKLLRESLDLTGVEPCSARLVGREHRAGDYIPRSQLTPRIGCQREPLAGGIHQDRARAAHRLRNERRGVDAGELQRGGMELEELQVTQLCAGPVRQGPAVAGGNGGVGGDVEQLTYSAGCQHHCGTPTILHHVVTMHDPDTRYPSISVQKLPDFRMLQQLDLVQHPDDLGQCAHQHRAGAVTACVDDAGPVMRRLEPEPQHAVGPAVEARAQRQQLADPVRTLGHEDLDRMWIGEPVTGGKGVGRVLGGAVARRERHRDAALGPGRRAVAQQSLGHNHRTPARDGQPPGSP